jgi:hypothetical protein
MTESTKGANRLTVTEKVLGVVTALLTLATGTLAYKTATITQAKEQAQVVAADTNADLSSLRSQYDALKSQHDVTQAENARLRAQLGIGGPTESPQATASVSLIDVPPLNTSDGNGGRVTYQFGPQTVNAKPYSRTMHLTDGPCSYNEATYQLSYKYKRLHVMVGLADGSIVDGMIFTVRVDEKPPSVVTIAPGQEPHAIDVDLTGAYRLTLIVAGSDRCAMGGPDANARVVWIDPTLSF